VRCSTVQGGAGWGLRSRLEPVWPGARMLHRHLDGVLRYGKHPPPTGWPEGDLYPR